MYAELVSQMLRDPCSQKSNLNLLGLMLLTVASLGTHAHGEERGLGERLLLNDKVRIYNDGASVRMKNDYPIPVFVSVTLMEFEGASMPPSYRGVLKAASDEAIFNVAPFSVHGAWSAVWRFNYWLGVPRKIGDGDISSALPPVGSDVLFGFERGRTQMRFVLDQPFSIYASRAGVVFGVRATEDVEASKSASSIKVYHEDDTWTFYLGIDESTLTVGEGERVKEGQLLGKAKKVKQSNAFALTFGMARLDLVTDQEIPRYSNIPVKLSDPQGNSLNIHSRDQFFWSGTGNVEILNDGLCIITFGNGEIQHGVLEGKIRTSGSFILRSVQADGNVVSGTFRKKHAVSRPWRGLFVRPEDASDIFLSSIRVYFDNVPKVAKSLNLTAEVVGATGKVVRLPLKVRVLSSKNAPLRVVTTKVRRDGAVSYAFSPSSEESAGEKAWLDGFQLVRTNVLSTAESSQLRLVEHDARCH